MLDTCYDVAVIGGGVVGCAILNKLQLSGLSCLLLEKSDHLVAGASCGNSGIWHCGFDTQEGTLEAKCIARASSIADTFYKYTKVPQMKCGAVMVAWTQDQVEKLSLIARKQNLINNQHDIKHLTREELFKLEPHLSSEALAGIYVPGESVMEPWLTAVGLAHIATKKGAKICCNNEVKSVERQESGIWNIVTSKQNFKSRVVINAAGLYGDHIDKLRGESNFTILPRKGDFAVFSKDARQYVNHIILPVPTEITKGIIIFPTVHGNVMVGPTAEEVEERDMEAAEPVGETVDKLVEWAHKVVPELRNVDVVGSCCGIRPATQYKDYQIKADSDSKWITVGGIRSTGATACLGIASHVADLIQQQNLLPHHKYVVEDEKLEVLNYKISEDRVGCIDIDDQQYFISHPITKFGLLNQHQSNSHL